MIKLNCIYVMIGTSWYEINLLQMTKSKGFTIVK